MKGVLPLIYLILLAISFPSVAVQKRKMVKLSDITNYRIHSVTHSVTPAHKILMIYMLGLEDNCSSVFFNAQEDAFMFAAVMAELKDDSDASRELEISYDTTLRSPWGDNTTCQLVAFGA